MTTVIAEERYADVIDEIKGLFELHWEEIALNKDDVPLDPDYSVYEALDRAGAMVICTVRNNGRLIGYAVYFVRKHPHYRNHTWAVSDLFWVNPSYRDGRIGDNLFAFIEKTLTDKGVHVMHTTCKTAHPAPAFLLQRRGHDKIEYGFSKRLN